MHCHTYGNGAQFELKGDTLNLPLPWLDEGFDTGVAGPSQLSLSSEGGDSGVFAELIKASTIW